MLIDIVISISLKIVYLLLFKNTYSHSKYKYKTNPDFLTFILSNWNMDTGLSNII